MHYSGLVTFRPPFEAGSLPLQVTYGCSHNKCSFCVMYKDVPFKPSPIEEIEEDLEEAAGIMQFVSRVFLENGDAFCLSADRLLDIADRIRTRLPRVKTIASYASINNVISKTDEELKALAEAGYGRLNIGLESGMDSVLEYMNKGYDAATARHQLQRLKDAGITFSLNIIIGAAGSAKRAEHAAINAAICNETQPHLVFISPLHVDRGSVLEKERAEGRGMDDCTIGDYIDEELMFLEALELDDGVFFGTHVSNPVKASGRIPRDKERLLANIRADRDWLKPDVLASKPRWGYDGRILF